MQQQLTTQQKVCAILQWQQEQHSQMVYDCGLAWLQQYLPHESQYMMHCITGSRIFWNWWRLHWNYRDEAFVSHYFGLVRLRCAEQLYKQIHDPATLQNDLYPNGVVLSDSYAKMIGDIQTKEVLCSN
jgi:hypothetical protein